MSKLFFYKLAVVSCFILLLEVVGLQVALIGATNGAILTTFKIAELPTNFLLQMAHFIGIVFILHVLVLAYAWSSARASRAVFRIQSAAAENIGLLVLLLAWIAIFLLNNAFITRSRFSYWGEFALGPLDQLEIAILAGALALSPLALIAWCAIKSISKRTAMGLAAGIAVCALMMGPALGSKEASESFSEPNVIVIGIDSFRPDYLHAKELVPTLGALLADSAVFSEVYTPMARTFPSWTSMLSGLHPLETGARINLIDPALVRRDTMITWQLREAGYHTVLATDERRFSNLDESYGFDTVIGPAAGAADFVLGLAGDLPLVNLLTLTDLGGFLFPHLHNNRAVSRLYRPEQFAEHVGREIGNGPNKPLFLITHLCLPHWPYKWGNASSVVTESTDSTDTPGSGPDAALETRTRAYESALAAVDGQIEILLNSLQSSGYLDNAIVVVLTDHGEGMGGTEESLVDTEDSTLPHATKLRVGHGTNLFAPVQNHTFMAFKRYGADQYKSGERRQRFFNYDLKPTLLGLLDLSPPDAMRGVSMVPWLEAPRLEQMNRSLFVETGFYLPAINELTININDVISQGSSYYLLNEDARLIINPSEMSKLIKNKQRGVLRGSLLLAQVPVKGQNDAIEYEWLLADITGRGAVKLAAENFASECNSQCIAMLGELLGFYGDELAIHEWSAYSAYLQAVSIADNRLTQ